MKPFFSKLFDTDDFPARWNCGDWDAFHGWLHIVSDLAIWAAYAAIPLTLIYFCRRKRRGFLFKRIVLLFAAFILTCGTVHLIEAIIFYDPIYRVSALVKFATAVVSWITVFALWKHMPAALQLPGLRDVNSRLNEELNRRRQAEKDLEIAHRELRMASSMAAHDLRSPIASALIMVEVTSTRVGSLKPERLKAQLEVVSESLKAMSATLNTLSSRADQEPQAPEEVDLGKLMTDVESALYSTLTLTDTKLNWCDLPTLVLPRDRLFHILLNLVENAIKHCGDQQPWITVAADRDETSVLIEVRDRGPGIPVGERSKVFQARYRVEDRGTLEGSGMGLAFCRRMTEDLGGSIEADENPAGGTIIRIRLPRRLEVALK